MRGLSVFLSDIDPEMPRCSEDALLRALFTLDQREREVVMAWYGLAGRPAQTLVTIGATVGRSNERNRSKERMRQIRNKALRKLRNPSRRRFFYENDSLPSAPHAC